MNNTGASRPLFVFLENAMNEYFYPGQEKEDDRHTSGRDWSLEQNRPVAAERDECKDKPGNVNETGLIMRKPL